MGTGAAGDALVEWGAVAQLGERLVRNEEVSGSIPLSSTKTICMNFARCSEARSMAGFFADSVAIRGDAGGTEAAVNTGILRCAQNDRGKDCLRGCESHPMRK